MVSAATLERVTAAAQCLRYVPHGAARALRSQRTFTVGAVIPTLANSLYAKATQALQKTLEERAYTLLLGCHEYDLADEVKVTRSLVERGIDGLVLVGAEHDDELFALLADFAIPHVLTWALDAAGRHSCVGFDNRVAAAQVAQYLLDLGHREFAMVAGITSGNDRARDRLAGVRDALAARGLEMSPQHVIDVPYTLAAGRAAMSGLLGLEARPTAVICGHDVLAMGAVMECRVREVAVPDDMSVTGFDDIEAASILAPPLTTVRIPMRAMGQAAAQQIFAQLDGDSGVRLTELAVELVVRGTSAAPSAR